MASIERRNSGWRVRWRDVDGRARCRQCPDKRAALRLAADVEEQKARGHRWEARDSNPLPTLYDAVEAYLVDVKRRRSAQTVKITKTALLRFLGWVEAKAGRTTPRVDIFSRSLLSEFFGYLTDEGLGMATRVGYAGHVNRLWAWVEAEHEGQVARPRPLELPTVPKAHAVAPTWEEMDRVIGEASPESLRRVLIVQRCTGLRVGQVLRLDWQDFDLETRKLHIRPELGKTASERAGRTVPIAPALLPVLKAWGPLPEGSVVGKGYIHNTDAAQAWTAAGVHPRKWQRRSTHAFRKGFVSGLRKAGADPDGVEYLVGHTLDMVGVYTDPDALQLLEAVALVPEVAAHLYADQEAPLAEVIRLRKGTS